MSSARTAIVGDVHGMRDEFAALLLELSLAPGDHLVSVGDLIRKGPDSPGVFRLLHEQLDRGVRVDFVLGNHEAKIRRHLQDTLQAPEKIRQFIEELRPEDRAWIARAPLHLELPEHGAIVIHAGVLPGWTDLPPADPVEAAVTDAVRADELVRVRHVTGPGNRRRVTRRKKDGSAGRSRVLPDDVPGTAPAGGRLEVVPVEVPEGSFVPLGDDGARDPNWCELYDGRFGRIYFGHQPFLDADGPVRFPHATALDLGCVYGGALAAVVLEEGREVAEFTIRADRPYAGWKHRRMPRMRGR